MLVHVYRSVRIPEEVTEETPYPPLFVHGRVAAARAHHLGPANCVLQFDQALLLQKRWTFYVFGGIGSC